MSGRKFFVGGNWKMNGSKASIDEIIKFMNEKGVNPKTGLIMDYVAKKRSFSYILPRDAMHIARTMPSQDSCLSVTRRYSVKTVKHILKHLTHHRIATPF